MLSLYYSCDCHWHYRYHYRCYCPYYCPYLGHHRHHDFDEMRHSRARRGGRGRGRFERDASPDSGLARCLISVKYDRGVPQESKSKTSLINHHSDHTKERSARAHACTVSLPVLVLCISLQCRRRADPSACRASGSKWAWHSNSCLLEHVG